MSLFTRHDEDEEDFFSELSSSELLKKEESSADDIDNNLDSQVDFFQEQVQEQVQEDYEVQEEDYQEYDAGVNDGDDYSLLTQESTEGIIPEESQLEIEANPQGEYSTTPIASIIDDTDGSDFFGSLSSEIRPSGSDFLKGDERPISMSEGSYFIDQTQESPMSVNGPSFFENNEDDFFSDLNSPLPNASQSSLEPESRPLPPQQPVLEPIHQPRQAISSISQDVPTHSPISHPVLEDPPIPSPLHSKPETISGHQPAAIFVPSQTFGEEDNAPIPFDISQHSPLPSVPIPQNIGQTHDIPLDDSDAIFLPSQEPIPLSSVPVQPIPPPHPQQVLIPRQQKGKEDVLSTQRDPKDFLKYPESHSVISFGFGGKFIFGQGDKENPSRLSLTSIANMPGVQKSEIFQQLKSFPGPLIGPSTVNRNRVLSWLDSQISSPLSSASPSQDTGDLSLLLSLLKLFLEHSGKLADNKKALVEASKLLTTDQRCVVPQIPKQLQSQERSLEILSPGSSPLHDAVAFASNGMYQEALASAIKAESWDHALALSAQLGSEVFADTLRSFALTLPAGCPLRNLYLGATGGWNLIHRPNSSGPNDNTPNIYLLDNWRTNLSTLLHIAGPKKARANSIGDIGDGVWRERRKVKAAHCCYLLAGGEVGPLRDPNSRIVLVGGDHKTKASFVSGLTVQLTEIMEYGKKLSNSQISSIPHFQPFKLWYAGLLTEFGLLDLARKYVSAMESLVSSQNIGFGREFIYRLQELSGRLLDSSPESSSRSWLGLGSVIDIGKRLWSPQSSRSQHVQRADEQNFFQLQHEDQPEAYQSEFFPPSSPGPQHPLPHPTPIQIPQNNDSLPGGDPNLSQMPETPMSPSEMVRTKSEPDLREVERDTPKSHQRQLSSVVTPTFEHAATTPVKTSTDNDSPSFSRRILDLFTPKKKKDQADLGEENAFEYNKELKRWVKKGATPEELEQLQELEKPPPPPPSRTAQLDSPMKSPPPMINKGHANGSFGMSAPPKRRMRYVDTFNEGNPATPPPPIPQQRSPLPQLPKSVSVFTPPTSSSESPPEVEMEGDSAQIIL